MSLFLDSFNHWVIIMAVIGRASKVFNDGELWATDAIISFEAEDIARALESPLRFSAPPVPNPIRPCSPVRSLRRVDGQWVENKVV